MMAGLTSIDVQKIRAGDEEEWHRFVDAYYKLVSRILRRTYPHSLLNEDIDDTVFEAFEVISSKLKNGDLKCDCNLKAYLVRVALNKATDRHRKNSRLVPLDSNPDQESGSDSVAEEQGGGGRGAEVPSDHEYPPVVRQVIRREERQLIRVALERIDKKCRTILIRHYFYGVSHAMLAEALQVEKVGTVGVQALRCRKTLLQIYTELSGDQSR